MKKDVLDGFLGITSLPKPATKEELSAYSQKLMQTIKSKNLKEIEKSVMEIVSSNAIEVFSMPDLEGQLPIVRLSGLIAKNKGNTSLENALGTLVFMSDPAAKDANGDTPLHALIKTGNYVAATIYASCNPMFDVCDANSKTPLECVQDLIDSHFVTHQSNEGESLIYDNKADQKALKSLIGIFKLLVHIKNNKETERWDNYNNPYVIMGEFLRHMKEGKNDMVECVPCSPITSQKRAVNAMKHKERTGRE